MLYKADSSKFLGNLLEVVENVLAGEFQDDYSGHDIVSTKVLLEQAVVQFRKLREGSMMYDDLGRPDELKPCFRHSEIADHILADLEKKLQCSKIPRAYAYKTLFIMYLLFERIPSCRKRSWREKQFMDGLPEYLEMTNYFKGIDCKHRLSVLLDQLPDPVGRRPLDISIVAQQPKPHYPPIGPVEINYNINIETYIEKYIQNNNGCQQFENVNNSIFTKY